MYHRSIVKEGKMVLIKIIVDNPNPNDHDLLESRFKWSMWIFVNTYVAVVKIHNDMSWEADFVNTVAAKLGLVAIYPENHWHIRNTADRADNSH